MATPETAKPVATPAAPLTYAKALDAADKARAEYMKLAHTVTTAVSELKKIQPEIEKEVRNRMAPYLKEFETLRIKKRRAFELLTEAEAVLAKTPRPDKVKPSRPTPAGPGGPGAAAKSEPAKSEPAKSEPAAASTEPAAAA